MTEELKTCPFCGGEAYARFDTGGKTLQGYASVECKKCGAVPYVHKVYGGLPRETAVAGVIKEWNRRADND